MKVLIVDDDALIRDSLSMLLNMEEDFEVAGTAENAKQALDICRQQQPDIVLMDIRMPVMDGVLGTKMFKEHFPQVKVVILTTFRDDEYITQALKNGARGYILKSQPADSIVEGLRAVSKGHLVLEQDVAESISSQLKEKNNFRPEDYRLTSREMEILQLVGQGMSNREIALKLFLTEGTTRNYITQLLEKLKLRDRTQLAIFYLKNFPQ